MASTHENVAHLAQNVIGWAQIHSNVFTRESEKGIKRDTILTLPLRPSNTAQSMLGMQTLDAMGKGERENGKGYKPGC